MNTAANLVEKDFLVGLFHISIIIMIVGFHKKKFYFLDASKVKIAKKTYFEFGFSAQE